MINNDLAIHKQLILGTPVFIIDNFLQDPDGIHDQCFAELGTMHKKTQKNTLNGVHFNDLRKIIQGDLVTEVDGLVKELTGQVPTNPQFATNELLLFPHAYNNPQDNWWWPHVDSGYNMIIYMSKNGDDCGTNLYHPDDFIPVADEHASPWIPKNKLRRIIHLEGKYNRMVLFDGLIPHGMNLVKDKYINEYRRNIVGCYVDFKTFH